MSPVAIVRPTAESEVKGAIEEFKRLMYEATVNVSDPRSSRCRAAVNK